MGKGPHPPKKSKRVMGFGTFDALHPGHSFYLMELKKMGDHLTVVIARDKSVERIKGNPPHFKEAERLKAVKALGIADEVVMGSETDFYAVIRTHHPNVLGFGYDQSVNLKAIKRAFPDLEMKRVSPHHPEKFKSSLIKKDLKSPSHQTTKNL